MVWCANAEQARERIGAALDAIDAAHAVLRQTSSDVVGNDFRIGVAERLETQERANRGLMYRFFDEIVDPPDGSQCIPAERDMLWSRPRVTPREIIRRFKLAARIRPRRSLTGPPLPPELPELARAVEAGAVGEDHIRAVCHAIDVLPARVSPADAAEAEHRLVARARKLERLSGLLDPEARAYFEAVAAAVRPGRHQPEGAEPEQRDARSAAQRCHDALKLGLKTAIGSGELGTHRGHPVTVVVTTTLGELDQAARAAADASVPMPAPARTGGGSRLPMSDLIRIAAEAIHYLAVFDEHTGRPLYLGRQKRVATADQRLICYARDRGCTRPNCLVPGYECEVHHPPDWAAGGSTDADKLHFACAATTAASAAATGAPSSPTTAGSAGPTAPARQKSTAHHR